MNSNEINDGRSEIEIDLSDDDFCQIAKLAHAQDITFNKMIELILEEQIKRIKAESTDTHE